MKLFNVCFCVQNYSTHIQNSIDHITEALIKHDISFRQIPLNVIHFTAYSFRNLLSDKSKNEMNRIKQSIYKQFNITLDPTDKLVLKFEKFEIIKKNILVAKFISILQVNAFINNIKSINTNSHDSYDLPASKSDRAYYPHISLGKIDWKHKQTNLDILNNIPFPDITITSLDFINS
jgi:hypothetical protein